jgi:protein-S-isoprenylcysteine O-methyltransferase Ste14
MLLNHIILAVCWILYCVLHSVLASLRVKHWVRENIRERFRYYRLFYTLFAALSLAALVFYQLSISSKNLFEQTLFSNIVGGVLSFLGVSLMLVCIRKYFFSLSGLKSLYQETPSSELMIAGIHRYMRHPLYTGTFAAIWGFWLLFPSLGLLIADLVITGYTLYAIRLEEEKLVTEFGEQYRTYQRKVPKLLPRFRPAERF